jgi:hypothetical protein
MKRDPYHVNATGRHLPRRKYECESCQVHRAIGPPKAGDSPMWPAKLNLSQFQIDQLLIAAAEYRDLSEEAGEYESVVAFVDWLAPDALKRGFASPIAVEPHPVGLAEKRRRHRAGAA